MEKLGLLHYSVVHSITRRVGVLRGIQAVGKCCSTGHVLVLLSELCIYSSIFTDLFHCSNQLETTLNLNKRHSSTCSGKSHRTARNIHYSQPHYSIATKSQTAPYSARYLGSTHPAQTKTKTFGSKLSIRQFPRTD